FVDKHAGGLFYMSGPQFSSRFISLPQTQGIRDILPVSFDQVDALDVESLTTSYSKEWKLVITPDGADHAMMRLDQDPRVNLDKWATLPGIYWSFPSRGVVPGAKSLMEHSDPALRTGNGN